MSTTDTLADLPLSALFSAPLVAAIDASAHAQRETIDLIREIGFGPDGKPETVAFEYATTEIDPNSGEERPRPKTLEVPILLFLSLPELVVHEVEQTFSAKIIGVESGGDESGAGRTERTAPSLVPRRLVVAPAERSETFSRRTRTAFDLDVTMRAEIENKSTGLDLLERSLTTTVTDRETESTPSKQSTLSKADRRERDDPTTRPEE